MENELKKAETLFNEGKPVEALAALNTIIQQEQPAVEFLVLRAKVLYRLQQWGEALNDLNHILEREPDHKTANNYKTMVLNIITYWNKDNYNP